MSIVDQKAQDQREAENFIKNYSRVANMLVDGYPDLLPQEKWLYVCLVRLCGKEGTRFLSLRYIAERTGFSIGALSASKKTGSPGMLKRLHEAGLIHAEIKKKLDSKGHETRNAQFHITITDIWMMNFEFFYGSTCSEVEHIQSESESPVRKSNGKCSEVERNTLGSVRKSNGTCSTFSTNVRLQNNTTKDTKITDDKNTDVTFANAEHDNTLTFSENDELVHALQTLLQYGYHIGNYGQIPGHDLLIEIFRPDGSIYFDIPETIITFAKTLTVNETKTHLSKPTNQFSTEDVEESETKGVSLQKVGLAAVLDPSEEYDGDTTSISTLTPRIASQTVKSQASTTALHEEVQQKLIEVPLEPPIMPSDTALWSPEIIVQTVEALLTTRFSEKVRGNSKTQKSPRQRQLEAAKKICLADVTRDEFLRAYSDTTRWWSIGPLTVVEMAAKCKVSGLMRVLDTLEKLELPTAKKVIQFPGTSQNLSSQAQRNREIYTGYDYADMPGDFYKTDEEKRAQAVQW